MSEIANVLASRYASDSIKDIFSDKGKVIFERRLWIAVLKAQKELGIDVPDNVVEDYEKVANIINLESIREREKISRHDVKARIEEFCDLAGHEHIHKGMTSRDLTDNVEQYQIMEALKVIRAKTVACLIKFAAKADEFKGVLISGRTHNVAAQPITMGKRLAMFGQEMLLAFELLENIISSYPLRGIKGPVGTLLDMKTLFKGDSDKLTDFQNKIAGYLGFSRIINAVGQVYPRSLDFQVISTLFQLGAAPSSFCKTLRIMAGHELASEGFKKGQVGSSAMPHKMNSRNCERVNGFHAILQGHLTMTANLAGDQWNEGDVSCSVVRRTVIADAFFAFDGLLETFMTILNEMQVYPEIIKKENAHYMPFLSTTTILMEAVKKGAGREEAHELIKLSAVDTINDLRSGKIKENDFLERLAANSSFPLSLEEMKQILSEEEKFLGEAVKQTETFISDVGVLSDKYPEAAKINPGDLI